MFPSWLPVGFDNAFSIFLIWIVPWLPLLRQQEGWLVSAEEMFHVPPTVPLVACLCLATAFLHTLRLLTGNGNTIVFFDVFFLYLAVLAGITEEIAFRGLLFNRQAAAIGVSGAVILNGVLFALYHFSQIFWGEGVGELFGARGLLLFVMGMLFSMAFSRWHSLTLTIIVHTVWNFLAYSFSLTG